METESDDILRYIRTFQQAEQNAVVRMKELGFSDAHLTVSGADSGIDIESSQSVAQVKWTGAAAGRPEMQKLFGARGIRNHLQMFFFAASGYSQPAIVYADEVEIRLFAFDPIGQIEPANSVARLFVKELQRKRKAERVASERAEAERVASERAEAERVASERAEAERVASERAEAERIENERAEAKRQPWPVTVGELTAQVDNFSPLSLPVPVVGMNSVQPPIADPKLQIASSGRSMMVDSPQTAGRKFVVASLFVVVILCVLGDAFMALFFVAGIFVTSHEVSVASIVVLVMCLAIIGLLAFIASRCMRRLRVLRWHASESSLLVANSQGYASYFPRCAPTLGDRRARSMLRRLRNVLEPGEMLWVFASPNSTHPLMNGLAVTNNRILAFLVHRLSVEGPRIVVYAEDISRIDFSDTKIGMKEMVVTTHSGESKSFGRLDHGDVRFIAYYANYLGATRSPN